MRYPKFLPDEGTIGFVAPAFGCATEPYKSAFVFRFVRCSCCFGGGGNGGYCQEKAQKEQKRKRNRIKIKIRR